MHKDIGERVQQVREYFKLSRKEFIAIIKVNRSTVSRIETGVQEPSDIFLGALLARFLVNPDWVKTGKGEMFIGPEEHIANGLKVLGAPKYGRGLLKVLDDPQYAELQAIVSIGEMTKGSMDPKVTAYIQYILDKWRQGDEAVRSWLMIQLGIAFREVAEEITKKEQK